MRKIEKNTRVVVKATGITGTVKHTGLYGKYVIVECDEPVENPHMNSLTKHGYGITCTKRELKAI